MISNSSTAFWAVTLFFLAIASEAEAQTAPYVVAPLPPNDPRNSFQPPQGGVYVVDSTKATIALCYPDTKDSKWFVSCTPATALPK